MTSLTCSISPWTCFKRSALGFVEKYSYNTIEPGILSFFYHCYHLLFNDTWKLVQAIRRCFKSSVFTISAQKLFFQILQKYKRNTATERIICHTHVGYTVLANIVKQISILVCERWDLSYILRRFCCDLPIKDIGKFGVVGRDLVENGLRN